MSSNYPVYLVDVFARERYAGNPLAVVVCKQPLPTASMQKIAAEMNFSETTFVARNAAADGGFATRIFTPVREIAFTGHPILGTAWVLRHKLLSSTTEQIRLKLGLGPVSVDFETSANGEELCWFDAPPMTLGDSIDAQQMAPALGLDLQQLKADMPIQVVSAGTAAIIVPVADRDALQRARLDLTRFAPLAAAGHPALTYLFCREPRQPQNDIVVRFFFEAREVREDPATGNGAAFLGAYLRHHGAATGKAQLRIEQGHELQRPSLIHLRVDPHRVRVGGAVIATLQGELLDPAGVY